MQSARWLRFDVMPETEEPAIEKSIICSGCARVVPEEVDFCPHCGAPLSGTSTTDPYKTVFARGQMYWRLTHGPMTPIVMVGCVLIFLATVPVVAYAFWFEFTEFPGGPFEQYLSFLFLTVYLAVNIALAVKVVRNYRRQKKPAQPE